MKGRGRLVGLVHRRIEQVLAGGFELMFATQRREQTSRRTEVRDWGQRILLAGGTR